MKMPKCPKTVSGKHIWGSEIVDYNLGHDWKIEDVLIPNCILKCKACGFYDDINLPKAETQ